MNFKNPKGLMLNIALISIIVALIVVGVLLILKADESNFSLAIDSPELIEDCWVTVDGKKAANAEIKAGKKIKIGYGCYPKADNIKVSLSVDDRYDDIVSIKGDTVTALAKGKATINVNVLFPGKLGGKVSMTLPVTVYSKNNDNTSNQSSSPPHLFGNSYLDNASHSTAYNSSNSSSKEKTCDICGKTIVNAFDHELLDCLKHYRCEADAKLSSHGTAACGEHLSCDGEKHELRSCLTHYECDKEFKALSCGHCACEHPSGKPCE